MLNDKNDIDGINMMKLMFVYFDESKMIPEMLTINFDRAREIKSRFVVMGNMMNTLVEFSSLRSAIRCVELLSDNNYFYTSEFYNNFRIVEVSGDDDNLQILAIVVNLVDFFDVLCTIKDGKFNKMNFNDEDFNVYYEKYINNI